MVAKYTFPMTAQDLEHPPLEVTKVPNPLEKAMLVLIHMQETVEVMMNVAAVMVASTQ